ncbi:hypothetical protein [Candidatus Harpocratesius sp.]
MASMIMEPTRRNDVPLEDQILYIFLLGQMPKYRLSAIDSMKYVFIIKLESYNQKKVLFRSQFKMNNKGPISLQVYGNRDKLDHSPFAYYNPELEPENKQKTDFLQLNENAYHVLDWIETYAQDHLEPFLFMLNIIEKYHFGELEWKKRQDIVYNMKVNGKKVAEYDKKTHEIFDMHYYSDWDIFTIEPQAKRNEIKSLLEISHISLLESVQEEICLYGSKLTLSENW